MHLPVSHGPRARILLAVGLLSLVSVAMGVMARDMTRQLQLLGAERGAALVAYGEVVASGPASWPGADVPFTALRFQPERVLLGEASGPLEVLFPGHGEERLSISPPASALRVGERVLLFLRADEALREHHPGAFKLDSFAEVYRTQRNGKGEIIVLGQGPGAAVAGNARLLELEPAIREVAEALRAAAAEAGR